MLPTGAPAPEPLKPPRRVDGRQGKSAGQVADPLPKPLSAAQKPPIPKSPAQKALEKLGLRRDIDLALHLPLRYEDETRIVLLKDARDGDRVQLEGEITHSDITFRPRRQLRVTLDDGSDTCNLRTGRNSWRLYRP